MMKKRKKERLREKIGFTTKTGKESRVAQLEAFGDDGK